MKYIMLYTTNEWQKVMLLAEQVTDTLYVATQRYYNDNLPKHFGGDAKIKYYNQKANQLIDISDGHWEVFELEEVTYLKHLLCENI